MTLWSSTLEKLLSFSINLFARQLYSPQSSHWIQFPSDLQQISVNAIFLRRRWMIWQWEARCTHVVLHRSAKSSAEVQVLADVINAFSLDHSHHTFAFMSPGMFRTPVANGVCEFWNDTEIKGKTTCALMCKQQQLRSPTWTEKQKGKMKNRSLNSRLAVMFLMDR